MDHFNYRDGELFAEDVKVQAIAERFGTPCYVYSRATLERHWRVLDDVFADYPHKICYAVKANSNIGLLNILAKLGSGFDIVSQGELERVLVAGGDPQKVVFSGVGKLAEEMQRALDVGIYCFNVESATELALLNQVAKNMNKQAPVSLRINPDIDPKTHPYISTGLKDNKFGIDLPTAKQLYLQSQQYSNLQFIGVDCHIGSQLTELAPFQDALTLVLAFIDELAAHGIELQHLDLGGGLGIRYRDETPPDPAAYAQALLAQVKDRNLELIFEPGRVIAANAGILLSQVIYLKHTDHKNFAVVDGAMNDLLRPALYSAWQEIVPVKITASVKQLMYDVVGPVCETGDFLGKERYLALAEGDLIAVRSAGAYGFVMSSNYNTRPRPAEVLVDGDQMHLIRRRETIAELFAAESVVK